MSLIDFPNVPDVPGVPILKRVVGSAASRLGIAGLANILSGLGLVNFGMKWGVYDQDGTAALTPDTITAMEVKGDQEITNHPVEAGQFASYNKVAKPRVVAVTMVVSGMSTISSIINGTSRESFLDALDLMLDDLNVYDIVTPDAVYDSMNLMHYDYKRTSESGVSMIIANCTFQEVRQTATTTYSTTATASTSPTRDAGAQATQAPTSAQQAAINKSTPQK